jgi:hypothetical protein
MIDCDKIKQVLNGYIETEFSIEQKKYGCHLVTPFLDHINDSISFHIFDFGNGKIQLTDMGHTLDRLDDLGINYKEGITFDKLMTVEERLRLKIDDEWNIAINSDLQNLPNDICKLITGIQEIGSFYLLAKPRRKFNFEKVVNTFFIENKIRPNRRKPITGRHNRIHKMDFVFREGKLICQTLHAEHKETASNIITRYIAEFMDIKDINPDIESMVIYNDKAPVEKANFFDLMEEKTNHVIPLKEEKEIIKLVKVSSSTL